MTKAWIKVARAEEDVAREAEQTKWPTKRLQQRFNSSRPWKYSINPRDNLARVFSRCHEKRASDCVAADRPTSSSTLAIAGTIRRLKLALPAAIGMPPQGSSFAKPGR